MNEIFRLFFGSVSSCRRALSSSDAIHSYDFGLLESRDMRVQINLGLFYTLMIFVAASTDIIFEFVVK